MVIEQTFGIQYCVHLVCFRSTLLLGETIKVFLYNTLIDSGRRDSRPDRGGYSSGGYGKSKAEAVANAVFKTG